MSLAAAATRPAAPRHRMGLPGEALAQARHRAGLSVAQVSEQTRIRPLIIRSIEAGDYSLCGDGFYARENIRSIAEIVGADPGPLIEMYDRVRWAPGPAPPASPDEPPARTSRPARPGLAWHRRPAFLLAFGVVATMLTISSVGYRFMQGPRPVAPVAGQAHQPAAHHGRVRGQPDTHQPAGTDHGADAEPCALDGPGKRGCVRPGRPGPRRRSAGRLARHRWAPAHRMAHRQVYDRPPRAPAPGHRPAAGHGPSGQDHSDPGHARGGRGGQLPDPHRRPAKASGPAGGRELGGPRRNREDGNGPPGETGRYVLVWFTRLPPGPGGTYQADVHGIGVKARR